MAMLARLLRKQNLDALMRRAVDLLGPGWRVLVAAEMVVGTGTGLGYSIIQARWSLDYLAAFACIAVICVVGFCVEGGLLGRLEAATVRRWGVAREKP